MTTRAPFLNQAYGGYYHREIPSEDAELTHVGPGTPCGEYFRRFWVPVARSGDLKDLPQRVRILGEDLVVFRDGSGNTGLMELHCPHRGTSLEFGIVCRTGLRCCYHGWLFNVDGRVPGDAGRASRLHTEGPAVPRGISRLWSSRGWCLPTWGRRRRSPSFPSTIRMNGPTMTLGLGTRAPFPCNWLQIKENCMDPAHLLFLHTIVSEPQVAAQVVEDFTEKPEWDYMETPVGMLYLDSRRVEDKVWVRIADFLPPTLHQFPPKRRALPGG